MVQGDEDQLHPNGRQNRVLNAPKLKQHIASHGTLNPLKEIFAKLDLGQGIVNKD